MCYFDSLTDDLEIHFTQNWTTQGQDLPISLQTFEFDSKLVKVHTTLKELVSQYKYNKQRVNKKNNS